MKKKKKPAARNAHRQQPLALGDFGICFSCWADTKHMWGILETTTEQSRKTRAHHFWTALRELGGDPVGLAEAFSERHTGCGLFYPLSFLPQYFHRCQTYTIIWKFSLTSLIPFHPNLSQLYLQFISWTSCSVLAFGKSQQTHRLHYASLCYIGKLTEKIRENNCSFIHIYLI